MTGVLQDILYIPVLQNMVIVETVIMIAIMFMEKAGMTLLSGAGAVIVTKIAQTVVDLAAKPRPIVMGVYGTPSPGTPLETKHGDGEALVISVLVILRYVPQTLIGVLVQLLGLVAAMDVARVQKTAAVIPALAGLFALVTEIIYKNVEPVTIEGVVEEVVLIIPPMKPEDLLIVMLLMAV